MTVHTGIAAVMALLLPWISAAAQDHRHDDDHSAPETTQEQVDHENHDHDAGQIHDDEGRHAEEDNHAGHVHHEGEAEEFVLDLTPESAALIDLKTSVVTRGRISKTIELPGEVGFNEDKLAHIAPRFAGIAQQAMFRVGDYVDAGDIMAVVESNESMNAYSIPASISGWVIERHITPGEYVSEENSIYVIADLSSVWVNLAVYPKDCDRIEIGQSVRITAVGSMNATEGTIDYIAPIIDFRTRSATARVVLPNPNLTWRPGTFVQATVSAEGGPKDLVVERDAVQYLNDTNVVFVVDGPNRFRPVDVVTGESDEKYTRIVSGLDEGTRYVSDGAFELKAKIVTSNLDPHAGHGH